MQIMDFLSAAQVAVDVRANDKWSLHGELARRAAPALGLSPDAAAAEIEKRDQLWPKARAFADAAIPSGYRGTCTVTGWDAACVLLTQQSFPCGPWRKG
jgi:hypothetical protein